MNYIKFGPNKNNSKVKVYHSILYFLNQKMWEKKTHSAERNQKNPNKGQYMTFFVVAEVLTKLVKAFLRRF